MTATMAVPAVTVTPPKPNPDPNPDPIPDLMPNTSSVPAPEACPAPAPSPAPAPALAPAPAPAPPRLRSSSIPEPEPKAASRISSWLRPPQTHLQGTLALTFPDEPPPEPTPAEPPVAGTDQGTGTDGWTGPRFLLPEPKAWAGGFVQAAMEVTSGLRSAAQLVRWTSPEVQTILARRGALGARLRPVTTRSQLKPRVRSVLTCAVRPGICEVSAVVADAQRVRAVAFRMEGTHGRWRVTVLEIG